jgi:hypothetical protein
MEKYFQTAAFRFSGDSFSGLSWLVLALSFSQRCGNQTDPLL